MHRAGREMWRRHAADELGIYGVAGERIPGHRIARGRCDRRGFRLVRLANIETRRKIARRGIGSGSAFFVASIPTPILASRNVLGRSAGGAAGSTVTSGCGGKAAAAVPIRQVRRRADRRAHIERDHPSAPMGRTRSGKRRWRRHYLGRDRCESSSTSCAPASGSLFSERQLR